MDIWITPHWSTYKSHALCVIIAYIILDLFKTQPWHSKCHYTYYLVFHQTFKDIHQYQTNIIFILHTILNLHSIYTL